MHKFKWYGVSFALVISSLLLGPSYGLERTVKLNFLGEVRTPITFQVIDGIQQFRRKFREQDTDKLFNHDLIVNPLEADFLIFFANTWADVEDYHSDWDGLKPAFRTKTDNQIVQVEKFYVDKADGGKRDMIGIFYNTRYLKDKPTSCFAEDVVKLLTLPIDQYKENNVLRCNNEQ